MSNLTNWNRQYRLRCGKDDTTGFELGKTNDEAQRATHISFSVEKVDSATLNTTKIKLWNLSKEQVNVLSQTGCKVDLSAGYGKSLPLIFRGTVSTVNETLDGADRLVEMEAVDGFAETSDTVVTFSYSGRIACLKILTDTAEALGLPIAYSGSAERTLANTYIANGYSYVGYAKYVLNTVCERAKLAWAIQNGVLEVRKSNESVSTQVHVLNKKTGLVKIPKKIYSSAVANTDTQSDTTADSLYGYEIEYFLNGAIRVGDKVRVESDVVTGLFMVYSLLIEGDNTEGDWLCTAQITEASDE